jgi:WD40 repeat protein
MVRSLSERTGVADAAWCPQNANPRQALIAVAGTDQKVRLFDAAASSGLPQQFEVGSPVRCVDWSPDGKHLAAGLASGELCVLGPSKDGTNVRRAPSSFQGICGVAWRPENPRLVAVADEEGLVWIWDVGRFLPVYGRVDMHLKSFRGMVSGNAELREMLANGSLRVVSRPAGSCRGLAWASDGDRLAIAQNGIEVWEYSGTRGLRWSLSLPATRPNRRQGLGGVFPGPMSEPARTFTSLAWHPGARSLAAGTEDGRVIVFDVLTGQAICEFRAPSAVTCVSWSRPGRHLAAGSNDGSLTLWGFER